MKVYQEHQKFYIFNSVALKIELLNTADTLEKTIEKVAREIGVSFETVEKWSADRRHPTDMQMVKSLSKALNVDASRLLTELTASPKDTAIKNAYQLLMTTLLSYTSRFLTTKYCEQPSEETDEERSNRIFEKMATTGVGQWKEAADKFERLLTEIEEIYLCISPTRWFAIYPEFESIAKDFFNLQLMRLEIEDLEELNRLSEKAVLEEKYDEAEYEFDVKYGTVHVTDIKEMFKRALIKTFSKVFNQDFYN